MNLRVRFQLTVLWMIWLINIVNEQDRVISRLGTKILKSIVPSTLETGPPPGEWRQSVLTQRESHMFCEILVPINGQQDGWFALEEAIIIARHEESSIHGLYVLTDDADINNTNKIQNEFINRCAQAGVNCDFQQRTRRYHKQYL